MSRTMGCVLGLVVAIASAPRMESRPPRRISRQAWAGARMRRGAMSRVTSVGMLAVLLLGGSLALGEPYWIDWDGSDWPEAVGYTRSWGNWDGAHQGGAYRTLENGILTYDSLYDPGVWDSYNMEDFGPLELGTGEIAVIEWRLKVDQAYSGGDPGVGLNSQDGWNLGYAFTEDHIRSLSENYLNIPFVPYVWHDYRVVSPDLRTYDLFIDGELVHQGTLEQTFPGSLVGFGDAGQNFTSGSLHHWDYFRFGVVSPEPSAFQLLVLLWVIVWRGARRG